MPEPDLIQQQRAILRAFRLATAERGRADAEAHCKQELDAAASVLSEPRPGQSVRRSARRSSGSGGEAAGGDGQVA